jgi:hypothetical protein
MHKEMDEGKKKEAIDPIRMEEDQIKNIMEKIGKMRINRPYQYKMNNKKREKGYRESLVSDEEEVEDIWDVEQIEEILCATYERKIRGPRSGIEGRTPIHININMEPKTPCVTNTREITPSFRQSNFSGSRET